MLTEDRYQTIIHQFLNFNPEAKSLIEGYMQEDFPHDTDFVLQGTNWMFDCEDDRAYAPTNIMAEIPFDIYGKCSSKYNNVPLIVKYFVPEHDMLGDHVRIEFWITEDQTEIAAYGIVED